MDQRDLSCCLEDCAGGAVERDGRFDAGLLGQAIEGLLEGVGAVGLFGAGVLAMRQGGLGQALGRTYSGEICHFEGV